MMSVSESQNLSGPTPASGRLYSATQLQGLEAELQPGRVFAQHGVADLIQERLLASGDDWEALLTWLGSVAPYHTSPRRDRIKAILSQCIARIDRKVNRQLNRILHHPRLQKLEASWRGLQYLAEQMDMFDGQRRIKLRILNASWPELCKDLEKAIEFDQSALFRKVYSEEFGTPGGEPFGILLGDYELSHRPRPGQRTQDLHNLRTLAQVAAGAFAPFITSAHPSLFGLDHFAELTPGIKLDEIFRAPEYALFRGLRNSEDLRFVGLTLPRVRMRALYTESSTRHQRFSFREYLDGDPDNALWGNAVYAFGATVLRAYAQFGWFANIRGAQRNLIGGGLVTDLPHESLAGNRPGFATQPPVEVLLSETMEKNLSELGLMGLCAAKDSNHLVFYSNPSLQEPKRYDNQAATASANLSSMLQYTLCIARFAHYLKVIGRDKVGSFISAQDCERHLQQWILRYATANENANLEIKAKHPLREARIEVKEVPGQAGHYLCKAYLKPHYQLDQLNSTVRLVTQIAPAKH